MKYTLEIYTENPELRELYSHRANHASDAGVDLYTPADSVFRYGETQLVDLEVKCRMVDENGSTVSYYLYPRSSVVKTPLQLANSVGIIDKDYRGNIKAGFRCIPTRDVIQSWASGVQEEQLYRVYKGDRLVQICAPDLSPLRVRLVDSLDETARGSGGFGSTGGTS